MPSATDRLLNRIASRPRLSALGLGLAAASGFQPLGLWPLALLAMGGFVLLLAQAPNWREAARLGWLFGVTHFTFANNWIATAFTYQANMPAVLGWLAVPLLALYLAVYPALAAGASWRLAGKRGGWALALAFAGCWIIAEWLRGWVFTGYAWDPFAVILLGGYGRPGIALLAPWLGTYALSGLAVLLGAALALLLARRRFVPLGVLAAATTGGNVRPAARRAARGHSALHARPARYRPGRAERAGLLRPQVPQDRDIHAAARSGGAAAGAVAGIRHDRISRKRLSPALLRLEQRPGRSGHHAPARSPGDRAGRHAADGNDQSRDCRWQGRRRAQFGLCDRRQGNNRRQLRQGASGALWRISPHALAFGAARRNAAGSRCAGLLARPWPAHDRSRAVGPGRRADLLRDRVLGRSRRSEQSSGLYLQPVQ